jgi:hypothetical protein
MEVCYPAGTSSGFEKSAALWVHCQAGSSHCLKICVEQKKSEVIDPVDFRKI